MRTPSLIQGIADSTLHRDRDQVYQAVTGLLLHFLHAHSVTLFHLMDDACEVRMFHRAVSYMDGSAEVTNSAVPDDPVPLARFPTYLECLTHDRLTEGLAEAGRLLTVFPLHANAKVIGFLSVESEESLAVPHIDLIHGILRIVENHQSLLEYGERDTLTGLLNRRTFETSFEKLRRRLLSEMDAPAAGIEPSWLALLDIDRFKSINDGFGHLFGDEVLLLVSQLMKQTFRGGDQLFRYGGEEFLILLDRASEAGAHIVLDRLRTTIASHDFPQVGRVTVSLGYTRIVSSDGATTCVERADGALYYSKNHGRNCCHSYDRLLADGHIEPNTRNSDIEIF